MVKIKDKIKYAKAYTITYVRLLFRQIKEEEWLYAMR